MQDGSKLKKQFRNTAIINEMFTDNQPIEKRTASKELVEYSKLRKKLTKQKKQSRKFKRKFDKA